MFERVKGWFSEKPTNHELNRATLPMGTEGDLELTDKDLDGQNIVSEKDWEQRDVERRRRS